MRGETPTLLRQLNEIQLLALLGPGHMSRQERVHERLEIGPPPLRDRIANLPVLVDAFAGELRSHRRQTLVEALLETVDFFVLEVEVVTGPDRISYARSSIRGFAPEEGRTA